MFGVEGMHVLDVANRDDGVLVLDVELGCRVMAESRDWLTPGEAARLLGVDQRTVRRQADRGRLRVVRTLGGHRRLHGGDVEAAAAEQPTRNEDIECRKHRPMVPTDRLDRMTLGTQGVEEPQPCRVQVGHPG